MKMFLKKHFTTAKLGVVALNLVLLMGLLVIPTTTTGCSGSQVVNEINVVLQEAASVLAVAEPNSPWVPELKQAIAALMTAEQQWQTGGTVQIVIDALNTIVAITAVIPITSVYSPLIDVLVAGIEAILAALPQSSTMTAVRATPQANPHVNAYKLQHHFLHSPAGNFKLNWNDVAKAHNLYSAVLQ
jgi:hypothetical protein